MSRRTKVTFNGVNLTDLYHVSNLRNSLLPKQVSSVNVPGMDGALLTGSRLTTRTITLTLTVKGAGIEERQRAARMLAQALDVTEPAPLSLSIDGGLHYLAMPTSAGDGARYTNALRFEVRFECLDPTLHGTPERWSLTSGGSARVIVGGTHPTTPLVEVTGARNGANGVWKLTLDGGDYLVATIPSGVTSAPIVADCEGRALRVNGSLQLLQPEADWLVLEPGEHTLTMEGTGTGAVTFEERWL
jgi:predicted phage tail component-like protein